MNLTKNKVFTRDDKFECALTFQQGDVQVYTLFHGGWPMLWPPHVHDLMVPHGNVFGFHIYN